MNAEQASISAMMIATCFILPTAAVAILGSIVFDSWLVTGLVAFSIPFTAFGIVHHDTPKAIGSCLIAIGILFISAMI